MNEDIDNSLYVALIGDIRGSRELENRNEAQNKFKQVVNSLNDHISTDYIVSQFTVTTGDEFQVLLTDAANAVEAAVSASDQLHPIRLRFGIGRGGLDTEINPNQAIGMDGPCFHRARAAINSAEKDEAWVRVNGWSEVIDRHINSMFDLVQCVREDWTDRQAQFARSLKKQGTQKRVAERHSVSRATVSQSLNSGHVQEVRDAENSLAELLQNNLSGDNKSWMDN